MKRDVLMVGMMGSGKSTVGRKLATALGCEFEDTDNLIIARFGRPIDQVFRIYGEEAFREHEHSMLKGLEPKGRVLATGGGIVLREDNWVEMRRLGTVVHLHVSVESLIERLARSRRKRPLLQFPDWMDRYRNIYAARAQHYAKADITVEAHERSHDEVVLAIVNALGAPK